MRSIAGKRAFLWPCGAAACDSASAWRNPAQSCDRNEPLAPRYTSSRPAVTPADRSQESTYESRNLRDERDTASDSG